MKWIGQRMPSNRLVPFVPGFPGAVVGVLT
jgi:hypothetical protein